MNDQPKKLGDVLAANRPLPERWEDWNFLDLMADDEKLHLQAPDVDYACSICGKVERVNAVYVAVAPFAICKACDKAEAWKEKNRASAPPMLGPTLDLPPAFLATRTDHADFPRRIWETLKEFDPAAGRGFVVYGGTGGGKTRLLCKVAERVVLSFRKSVKIFWPGEFQVQVAEKIRSERSFSKWRRDLQKVDFLAFDDFFSAKMTERAEGALFDLVDDRVKWSKPIAFTTQKSPTNIKQGCQDTMRGDALMRRLKENCEFFRADPPTEKAQGKLTI